MKVVPVLIVWFVILLISVSCFVFMALSMFLDLGGEQVKANLANFAIVGTITLVISFVGACIIHDTI